MPQTTLKIDFNSSENVFKTFTFEIKRAVRLKTYFGGYKDNHRHTTLHHAFSQTNQSNNFNKLKFDRDTQIIDTQTKSVNPFREFGCQTPVSLNLFMDPRKDIVTESLKYFSSELWLQRRTEATIYIQKIMRGCLARIRIEKVKKMKQKIENEKKNLAEIKNLEINKFRSENLERRTHPKVG